MMTLSGKEMYDLASELFPICRSITGNGVRETLRLLQQHIPSMLIHEVPTGQKVFDWEVPNEWNIRDAYIINPRGEKIVDFKKNNLHIVGYSEPVDRKVSLGELNEHLYSLPGQPLAIPYVTSYYTKNWGFCLPEHQRAKLEPGDYHVFIDSSLTEGSLTYGEIILKGHSTEEIFLSTYICHPSLANNELSGPVLTTSLAKWLSEMTERRLTYRIVFIPETIGSIVYLSKNYKEMKKNIIAGFNVTCVGDDKNISYLESRDGNTLADRIAKHVLRLIDSDFLSYSFLERGSDERQYCSPGIDLPVVSIMRTKYGEYEEYHTSYDDLSFISAYGLEGSQLIYQKCLEGLETNKTYKTNVLCEPQLGKRDLYFPINCPRSADELAPLLMMKNLLAYCDGYNDLLTIAEKIDAPIWKLADIIANISKKDPSLLRIIDDRIDKECDL
jgi:aminopeptidase-like protein